MAQRGIWLTSKFSAFFSTSQKAARELCLGMSIRKSDDESRSGLHKTVTFAFVAILSDSKPWGSTAISLWPLHRYNKRVRGWVGLGWVGLVGWLVGWLHCNVALFLRPCRCCNPLQLHLLQLKVSIGGGGRALPFYIGPPLAGLCLSIWWIDKVNCHDYILQENSKFCLPQIK